MASKRNLKFVDSEWLVTLASLRVSVFCIVQHHWLLRIVQIVTNHNCYLGGCPPVSFMLGLCILLVDCFPRIDQNPTQTIARKPGRLFTQNWPVTKTKTIARKTSGQSAVLTTKKKLQKIPQIWLVPSVAGREQWAHRPGQDLPRCEREGWRVRSGGQVWTS